MKDALKIIKKQTFNETNTEREGQRETKQK